jgi:integrase/recombinase XerD
MILYHRHNTANCQSTNPESCTNKRHPCPIWVRGATPDGEYVEKSLKSLTGKITRNWTKAKEFLLQWEIEGKAPRPTIRPTVKTWTENFLQEAVKNNLSSETIRKYKYLISQLEAFAADKGIRFVDEFDVQTTTDFRLTWTDGPLTTSKKLEPLRSVMKFAVERDWLVKNPALSLKPPKIKAAPTLPFTQEEMRKIMEAAQTPRTPSELDRKNAQRVYVFIAVMRSSGLRISDVTRLAVSSLNGDRLSLYQMKTNEFVSILLDRAISDGLRAVLPLNRSNAYFFWTGESKLSAAASVWRKRIADVFKRAGTVNGHTHRFRDTFAVALLEKGRSIEDVSRLLGHTSIRITERHYNPWVKSRQAALDKAVQGANGWLAELGSTERAGRVLVMSRRR